MGKQSKRRPGGKAWQPKSAGGSFSEDRGRADKVRNLEFGVGKATDAADFKNNKITLCRYIGSQSFAGSAEAAHALERGVAPVPVKPEKPKIPKRRKEDGTDMSNEEYKEKLLEYKEERFEYERDIKNMIKRPRRGRRTAQKCTTS